MHPTIPRTYSLEDLDALLDCLRRTQISPEEVQRRRRVAAEVDRLREESLPIPIPVEDLILREQGEYDD